MPYKRDESINAFDCSVTALFKFTAEHAAETRSVLRDGTNHLFTCRF